MTTQSSSSCVRVETVLVLYLDQYTFVNNVVCGTCMTANSQIQRKNKSFVHVHEHSSAQSPSLTKDHLSSHFLVFHLFTHVLDSFFC